MQQIEYIADVPLNDLSGGAVLVNGKAIMSQYEFFLSRIGDPAFAGAKQGIDALALAVTTKIGLDNQREMAAVRGFWLVEDEQGEGLKRATNNPQGGTNTAIAESLYTLSLPIKNMKPYSTKPPESKLSSTEQLGSKL